MEGMPRDKALGLEKAGEATAKVAAEQTTSMMQCKEATSQEFWILELKL